MILKTILPSILVFRPSGICKVNPGFQAERQWIDLSRQYQRRIDLVHCSQYSSAFVHRGKCRILFVLFHQNRLPSDLWKLGSSAKAAPKRIRGTELFSSDFTKGCVRSVTLTLLFNPNVPVTGYEPSETCIKNPCIEGIMAVARPSLEIPLI